MTQYWNFGATVAIWKLWFSPRECTPHLVVDSIASLSPKGLKKAGVKGVVFDADNTLIEPYGSKAHPKIRKALMEYRKVFGKRLVILSNSAGTRDDKGYVAAKRLEKSLSIRVLRHEAKKPANIPELKDFFPFSLKQTVIFGDRLVTDVYYGNREGMLSVLTKRFTDKNDNLFVVLFRKHERWLLRRRRIRPPAHALAKKMKG